MERRQFLKNMGKTAGALSLTPSLSFSEVLSSASREAEGRVLVLLYLNGGNDGLNTFVPLDQYEDLKAFRPDIIPPKNRLLALSANLGLHPALAPLQDLFENDKVGIIRDVGYKEANLSHFRSREIIDTGSNSTEQLDTGWLGRHLSDEVINYPADYPNNQYPDPIVLAMSNGSSQNVQGTLGNYNVVAGNPSSKNSFDLDDLSVYDAPSTRYGEELDFLRIAGEQTNSYKEIIFDRYSAGTELAPSASHLSTKLKDIARLIDGGSQTKVFVLHQSGYDTHGGQVEAGDTTSGKHADLLADLSTSIKEFQTDLDTLGLSDRVVGLTYTEFGRRVTMNESLGTDHGHASTWFVWGDQVNPVIHGETPELPTVIDNKANLALQHEFHNVYYSLLTEWMGAAPAKAADYFGETSQSLNLIKPEFQVSNKDTKVSLSQVLSAPKVGAHLIFIDIQLNDSDRLSAVIYDINGSQLSSKDLGYFEVGDHRLRIPIDFKLHARQKVFYQLIGKKMNLKGSMVL